MSPQLETWDRILAKLMAGPNVPAAAWTTSISDRIAMSHISHDLLRRLERLCDANPVGAASLISFVVDVFDEGREVGYDDAVNETSAKASSAQRERLNRAQEEIGRIFSGRAW